MNKTETIENFKINYKKHPFSKSIKITLKQDNSILVTMPYLCPFKMAKNFLMQNFSKITSYKFKNLIYTPDFKTKFDTLNILQGDKLQYYKKNKIINFIYPKNQDFNSSQIQSLLKKAHIEALKIEAKNYLPFRLKTLADKFGFKYNKLSLKNQKTRFGSCSYVNNINLNINLMKYDFDIIDYVLIHELVHTKIKNHSERFWLEVEKYCPNYKVLRKKLKNN